TGHHDQSIASHDDTHLAFSCTKDRDEILRQQEERGETHEKTKIRRHETGERVPFERGFPMGAGGAGWHENPHEATDHYKSA
ncbi:MAG TPA: hypothetical protein VFK46_05415, partial [Candidatus Macondimonas sp.]|nr:hypothetical protein [Candidatus Macondimonas sp.]